MGVSKIIINSELLLDLTGDTVTPADVREGVIFHGADGEEKTGTMSPGVDVSGADAAASDVLSGKKFVGANGEVETGSMTNHGAVSQTLDGTTKTYTVPAGYHDGTGTVSVTTQTKSATPSSSAQTISPDSGKLLSSVSVAAIPSTYKRVYSGTVSPTSGATTITFSLGAAPAANDTFLMIANADDLAENDYKFTHFYKENSTKWGYRAVSYYTDDVGGTVRTYRTTYATITYSGTSVTVTVTNYGSLTGGYNWYLIKA